MLSRRIAVIYCVTNTLNGKQYVGVTSKTSALRWKEHCWKALRNPATEFHYSLAKHGPEIFTVSDIASALSDPSAVERDVIQHLRPVYNMTNGGEFTQGKRVSPEVIEKLRIANTGKVRSDEYRKRMGEIQKNSYATNPHRMAESVKRLGEMRLLIDHDKRIAAIKKCASEGRMFNNRTPEQQIKFQTAGHTPETIWKAARAKDKPVECVSLNVIFDSMLDAARDTGVHFSNVARCAAGKRKTAGGLVFRYI